jgi:hypothetical protein
MLLLLLLVHHHHYPLVFIPREYTGAHTLLFYYPRRTR